MKKLRTIIGLASLVGSIAGFMAILKLNKQKKNQILTECENCGKCNDCSEENEVEDLIPLESFTRDQLREIAKELKIKNYSRMTKADLISAIYATDKPEANNTAEEDKAA